MYIKDMRFHYVSEMIDVVQIALMKEKVANSKDIKFIQPERKGF